MIHVIFSSSGAGSLRQALKACGRQERVADILDDLSWGPIANGDLVERQAWLNQNLPSGLPDDVWDWIADEPLEFFSKLECSNEHLVWVAPQNAKELCGLHWYLHHFGGERASFILVDQDLTANWEGGAPYGLGELGAEQFQYLLANAKPEAWNDKRFPRQRWTELCDGETNLRLVAQGTAVSVPDDYLDDVILQQCKADWRKLGYVVGETMVALWAVDHAKGDDFIKWRLRELGRAGKIVTDGSITHYAKRDEQALVRLA